MLYTTLLGLHYDLKTSDGRKFVPSKKGKNVLIHATTEDSNAFNAIPEKAYDYLIATLNCEDEITVLLNKVEGTTTDYTIIKNKCFTGVNEAKRWLKTAEKSTMKYDVYDYETGIREDIKPVLYFNLVGLDYKLLSTDERSFSTEGECKNIFIYCYTDDGEIPFNSLIPKKYDILIDILNNEDNLTIVLDKPYGHTASFEVVRNKRFSSIGEYRVWRKKLDPKESVELMSGAYVVDYKEK